MLIRKLVGQSLAISAAALFALSACSSNPKSEDWDLYNENLDPSTRGSNAPRPAPRPEPAPVRAATPAAAPAPASSGNVLYIPTGERNGSGLMIEKRVPAEVVTGAEFEYEIIATNLTNGSLDNVLVTDTLGPGFKIVSSDPSADMQGQTARWALGSLAGKAARTIKIRAVATGTNPITSCASGAYSLALCSQINVVQPALRLTKQAPAEVLLCDPIVLRLVVTNSGTGVARDVKVRDSLPSGLTTADGRTSVELDAGNLAAGQSKEFQVTVKAAKTGTYENSGTAASAGGLTTESNKTSTIVRQPALSLTCKAPERVFLGREASFEFTVKNTGDAACSTTISMPLPSGATFVSATDGGASAGGNVNWNVGNLTAGASKTVSVTVMPSRGSVNISASAQCPCATPASTTCSTNVVGIPALLLNGFDNPDPIEVGKTTVYTLTVTNQGTANLTNVQLTCMMDEGDTMEFVSATGGTAQVSGKSINFPAIGTLAPGANQTYTITIRAKNGGQVQFRAEAKSNEITRPLIKVETTNFYK